MSKAIVYMHTAEQMDEVDDATTTLFVGASVFLGKGVAWHEYSQLYDRVYNHHAQRCLREDGMLLVVQTNTYMSGRFICRYKLLLDLLLHRGWELIDERVWTRCKANNFQLPFSHVFVLRPPGGIIKRGLMNKRNNAWYQGIWDYPQKQGGEQNAWPNELCALVIDACTQEGELVVDPFAGTGRLLGKAAQMGRHAIGYEINHDLIPVLHANNCKTVH